MTRVVLLSGGLDSTCAAAVGRASAAVIIDYHQRHADQEIASAVAVAEHMHLQARIVTLPAGLLSGGALTGDAPVPEGRYDDPSMAVTVVPGRNLLLTAVALAGLGNGDTLIVGVHAGDHPVYPDCRPPFWAAVSEAAMAYGVTVNAPFLRATKADALTAGWTHGAPVHLTWSCYVGGKRHCGRCGTCVERAEAFALAGLDDPTDYADRDFWRQAVSR